MPVDFINGGFETGDFTGWIETDPSNVLTVSTTGPRTGTYDARFLTGSADIREASFRQTITDVRLKGKHVAVDVWTWQVTYFAGGAGSYWEVTLADDKGNSVTTGHLAGVPPEAYINRLLELDIADNANSITLTVHWYKSGGGRIYDVRVDDIHLELTGGVMAGLTPALLEVLG